MLRIILNSKIIFCFLLTIPAVVIMRGLSAGAIDMMDAIAPAGEWSARMMIAAMMIGPLTGLLGPNRWLRWLTARRRYLGVAAFLYAVAHMIFYLIDMGAVDAIVDELLLPGIWTGWTAMGLMLPIALTSNDASMCALKAGWKKLQRLVYPAAVLTLLHWVWVHNNMTEAMLHFAPLLLLYLTRIFNFNLTQKAGA